MDLCGPMRVASVNGKKYIIVIVDDYSRFTWVKCLSSKDEAPYFIIKFLKMIQVWLKVPVRRIRTDNRTEFVNQTLREYYENIGISHETSVARSPQQNSIVERCNHTLIEASRTMLIYAKALLFLWAEAVATAYYTQNHSIIRLHHGKTLYELLHDKPPDLSFFHLDECLALADLGASINLMPLSVWKKLSLPELTPTRMTLELADRSVAHPKGVAEDVFVKTLLVRSMLKKCSDFRIVQQVLIPLFRILSLLLLPPSFTPFKGRDFLLEEIEACLSSDSIPSGIDDADFDPEGDIRLLEKLLNDDPSSPLPPKELNFEELKTIKSSIDDPPELELKDL
ncbi:retrovirus-related pol polyprotein from transposon TNT 1-94 [Tanacetum coccineum]